MRLLRALGGSVLWILAGLLGLLGVLLSVTVVLLPLGLPLLWAARKLFRFAMTLLVPRKVRHPVDELGKSVRSGAEPVGETVSKATDSGRSFLKRQRKRFA